jgi:hypothetical protein
MQHARRRSLGRAAVLAAAITLIASTATYAAVSTDQPDYAPGSTVTISGDNSNGAGYLPGDGVDVAVAGPNGWAASCSATVTDAGTWSCQVALDTDPAVAVGDYTYTATSIAANGDSISESGTFTDATRYSISGVALAIHGPSSCVTGLSPFTSGASVCVTATVTGGVSGSGTGPTPDTLWVLWYAPSNPGTPAFSDSQTFTANGSTSFSHVATATGTWTVKACKDTGGSPTCTGGNLLSTGTFAVVPAAPGDPGAPYLDTGSTTPNNTGTFKVDWDASTTAGVTYELQKRDADDASWTSVALSDSSATSQAFTGEVEGSWRYQVRAAKSGLYSDWATDASAIVVVDKTAPNAPSAAATTGPAYTSGGSNWWKDTVTVSFSANGDPNLQDASPGSGVDAATLTPDVTYTTQGHHAASGTVEDHAGNVSSAGALDVYVDTDAPTFGACPAGGDFTLGSGDHTVGPIGATDPGGSGVDAASSTLSGVVHTDTIGTKTLTFTAYDNVGHQATTTCDYHVIYHFTGFFQPVDNPDICNVAKVGSAIPVKFSLDGYQGMSVIASGYPQARPGTCGSNAIDAIEQTVTAGQSSLNYDPITDQYVYVWKTDKAWAGKAIQLDVLLVDGTHHYARFSFTK